MLGHHQTARRVALAAPFPAALLLLALTLSPALVLAQGGDYASERARASRLLDEAKFEEALPLFEKLSKERPDDAGVMFGLGFTMLVKASSEKDPEARRQGRKRAREVLVRAKELGFGHPMLQSILEQVGPDGETSDTFSSNREADEAMREGEAAYVRNDLDKALAAYQRALQLDPRLYEAALFAGDMYSRKGQPGPAGEWFARAVSIDPDRETAYRLWGTALLQQGKMTEARDKFIEAYLAEPHSRMANTGLVEWGNAVNVKVGHPQVEFLSQVFVVAGEPAVANDPRVREGKDGSGSWNRYGQVRAAWMKERFAKEFPQEKTYRHTMREEAEALAATAQAASEELRSGRAKTLTPSLATLIRMKEMGLLEAYVLLGRPDEGVAQDYAAYRKAHPDKLRQYVLFAIEEAGK